ncbi:MAG: hypothetical protein AB4062_02655 [Crocosphaera sp.]
MARQIHGTVDRDGRIIGGSGDFHVQKFDRGFYAIHFELPFNNIPTVVSTVYGNTWTVFNMSTSVLDDLSPYHFVCLTSTPDQAEDCGFTFTVTGD